MNPTIGDVCGRHLRYMKWADNLLFTAIQMHLPERKETLEHIFMAQRIWLARVQGTVDSKLPVDFADWPKLHEQWLDLDKAETDWIRVVEYRTLAGVESGSPLWEIVMHVANHGSYHRGQVAASLRAAGFAPPGTDLIIWYRQNPSSSTSTTPL